MKVLSIDVGIKNLAHCLFDVSDKIVIQEWKIINLNHLCKCGSAATHQLCNEMLCKKHSCHTAKSLVELIGQCTHHNIPLGTMDEMKKSLKQKTVAIHPTLVDLGKQLMLHYEGITADIVLIENQIGPLASKMKAMQGMIIQYWLMRNSKVECISACNKLKLFHTGKTTYAERKKLRVHYTNLVLELNQMKPMEAHKKKDDLADTFLQGVWYFHNNNCGLLKINCS